MRIRTLLIGAGIGAALLYLFDPERGRARRARLQDQAGARVRRARRQLEGTARHLRDGYQGAAAQLEAASAAGPAAGPEDDLTVLSRVESVLFGAPGFPKETVEAEVVDGVLTLRGEVPSEEEGLQIVEAASRIKGVAAVESLLHLPGQPAPNKAAARRAGG
jgi:osmotically-inducible protein OsmY